MPSHVALLRGVNVGGRRILPMAVVREALVDLGHVDVETYIQSGNVVFTAVSGTRVRQIERDLEDRLTAVAGFDVPVVVRTAAELRAVHTGNPFLAEGVDPGELHVAFLEARATGGGSAIDPATIAPEALVVAGREVYLRYPNGLGRARLTAARLEKAVGTPATVRNWRTVESLLAMLDDPAA